MENKLILFLQSIDWLLVAVLVIGGRYWGRKYFNPFKSTRYNFLLFATVCGATYIILGVIDGRQFEGQAANVFLTYLFATSFYEMLAASIFLWLEKTFPILAKAAGIEPADAPGGPGSNPTNPPPPPPGT